MDLYGWNVYHHIPVAIHNAQDMEHFPRNAFSLNRFDLSQNVYSRADDIPCRYGKYNFELYYPELENSIFKWEQTSDPMNTSITPAQGFSLISGPPDYTPHPVIPFVGLQSDSRYLTFSEISSFFPKCFEISLKKGSYFFRGNSKLVTSILDLSISKPSLPINEGTF